MDDKNQRLQNVSILGYLLVYLLLFWGVSVILILLCWGEPDMLDAIAARVANISLPDYLELGRGK